MLYHHHVVHYAPLMLLQSRFLNFWHYHPYILQHFNEMFFTLVHNCVTTLVRSECLKEDSEGESEMSARRSFHLEHTNEYMH